MAWTRAKLSDVQIRSAKPSEKVRKLMDGGGLQLWIMPEGGKYWRQEIRFQGKRNTLAHGTYPEISLSRARELAVKVREDIANGIDPARAKKEAKQAAKLAEEHSFRAIAGRLIEKKRREERAPITIQKIEWVLAKG